MTYFSKRSSQILFVFAAAFLLRLPSFFVPYYNIDEITNAIFGRFLVHGDLGLKFFLGNTYIFTHYFYAAMMAISNGLDLFWVHLFHAFWVGGTAIVLCFAGCELTGRNKGGLAAGLLYAFFSLTFFSKDFASALSESLSLLPASLAAYFYFRGLSREKLICFFWAGFCMGVSSLFKMPSGIMIVPAGIALLLGVRFNRFLLSSLLLAVGLVLAMALPLFFYGNVLEAFKLSLGMVANISDKYVNAYDQLPFIYWFTKFLLRTSFIAVAALPLWYFAFGTIKHLLIQHPLIAKKSRLAILFLFIWFVCAWFVTILGKRVFFHYFVFVLPSLCLLASFSLCAKNLSWKHLVDMRPKRGAYGLLIVFGLLSGLVFLSDAIVRWSSPRHEALALADYIEKTTRPSDTIYVWGLYPQLYLFSNRMPSTTDIWADSFAGFSTGTPAMEYMRSEGKKLTLPESVVKDLNRSKVVVKNMEPVSHRQLNDLSDQELLTMNDILGRIDSPSWKKLMESFFRNPPVLFVDTSPSGIRNFSNYPISKYELLKKFIEDNYQYDATIDNMIVYRIRKISSDTVL